MCPRLWSGQHALHYYNRWTQRGVWQRLFKQVAAGALVPNELRLDSSHVQAYRSAAGGKGGVGASGWPPDTAGSPKTI